MTRAGTVTLEQMKYFPEGRVAALAVAQDPSWAEGGDQGHPFIPIFQGGGACWWDAPTLTIRKKKKIFNGKNKWGEIKGRRTGKENKDRGSVKATGRHNPGLEASHKWFPCAFPAARAGKSSSGLLLGHCSLCLIVPGLLPLLGDTVLLLALLEPTCAGEVTHESWSPTRGCPENAAGEHSLLLTRSHLSSWEPPQSPTAT